MSTPPEDDPVIREGGERIGRAWFRSLSRWMDRVRPQVLPPDGPPQPQNVDQNRAFWGELMQSETIPEVTSLYQRVRNRILRRDAPVTDADSAAYLNEVGNRLVRVPDEVYALIVREIEQGIARAEGIPDIRDRVQQVLTATATPYWRNRAVVVARTEAQGAVNAGAYYGAVRAAAERGDPAPQKIWISTRDARTRPTHVEADRQQQPLAGSFLVGTARLLFPGDPRGPAQEVINCRCTFIPVTLGDPIDWTNRQDP